MPQMLSRFRRKRISSTAYDALDAQGCDQTFANARISLD